LLEQATRKTAAKMSVSAFPATVMFFIDPVLKMVVCLLYCRLAAHVG
jgi:hypothetical protein